MPRREWNPRLGEKPAGNLCGLFVVELNQDFDKYVRRRYQNDVNVTWSSQTW